MIKDGLECAHDGVSQKRETGCSRERCHDDSSDTRAQRAGLNASLTHPKNMGWPRSPSRRTNARPCRMLHQPTRLLGYNPLRCRRKNQLAGMNGPAQLFTDRWEAGAMSCDTGENA